MEHDADTLKKPMAEYLERLSEALETNHDDINELRKVFNYLVADRDNMVALASRVNEQIGHLSNLITKKTDISNYIKQALATRKE